MTEMRWEIRGEYMESCNCDYVCPCVYTNPQGPATNDHCYSMMLYHIEAGRADGVVLDGLAFGLAIRSGRVMADGEWVFAAVVDERADEAQRDALARIAGGEAGGVPGMIRDGLVSDFRGVQVTALDFTIDGLRRVATAGGVFHFEIEGVEPRAGGGGEPMYLDNTSHPANRRLALARTSALRVEGFDLDLDLVGRGNNGHFAPFAWHN